MSPINLTAAATLSAADNDRPVFCDATSGNFVVTLPASGGLTPGWKIPYIGKIDPQSNVVEIRPQGSDRLNHYWDANCSYCPFLNLSQDQGDIIYRGEGDFFMRKSPLNRSGPQSQRTVQTSGYNVTPQDVFETLRCTPPTGGQGLYFNPITHFCPPSPVTGGCYLSWTIWIENHSSQEDLTIFPSSGDALNGITNNTFTVGPGESWKVYIASDGLSVRSWG